MQILKNQSLKAFNTFGIEAKTDYFIEINNTETLKGTLKWAKDENQPILFLNGGSNVLITRDWKGLVIKLNLEGKEVIKEEEDSVEVKVQSGENWHQFVLWTLSQDFGGLENLSLIPGNAGTAPMQNIGAYGVEIKDTMVELTALRIDDLQLQIFTNKECHFGYRESVFKNIYKNQYIILDVTFRLSKRNHQLHTEYGSIKNELAHLGIEHPTIHDVSRAVINIRSSKLPNPAELGNSGSFFKNPVISKEKFEEVKKRYPEIHAYPQGEKMKVAAGWLIDRAGWKGKRFGDAGVHKNQALVLVNYGKATGQEIYDLSERIVEDIYEKFGIKLEREVNII